MSWRTICGRLTRLERSQAPGADGGRLPPYFWDVMLGGMDLDRLAPAARARYEQWWAAECEENRRIRVTHMQRWVDQMRPYCETLGDPVPTAEELVERQDREPGFDVVKELFRLVEAIPVVANSPTLVRSSADNATGCPALTRQLIEPE